MAESSLTVQRQSNQDNFDDLLNLFRDHVARTDAFLTAAKDLIERLFLIPEAY
jgi:hypothetical protein